MNVVKVLLFLVAGLLVIALLGAGCAMSGYNRAVKLDEDVKTAWAQVENQLQRRYELIPNLEATVKGTTKQERDVFLGIAKSREAYFQKVRDNAPVAERQEAANQTESALSRLLLFQEQYPELRSNEAFRDFMAALEGSENRLSVERMRYNEAARELNKYVRSFPSSLWARLAGVGDAKLFESATEAKTAPKVDFERTSG